MLTRSRRWGCSARNCSNRPRRRRVFRTRPTRRRGRSASRLPGPNGIDKLLKDNKVVALVGPTMPPAWKIDAVNGDQSSGGGAGNLAAVAGYPHLTVPMGLVKGLPVGLSFIGPKWSEQLLLNLGYAYEQARGTVPDTQILPLDRREPGDRAAVAARRALVAVRASHARLCVAVFSCRFAAFRDVSCRCFDRLAVPRSLEDASCRSATLRHLLSRMTWRRLRPEQRRSSFFSCLVSWCGFAASCCVFSNFRQTVLCSALR